MDYEDTKNAIELFLEKNCESIRISVKNGGGYTFENPNQEVNGVIVCTVETLDSGIYAVSDNVNGCTYNIYVPYSSIDSVVGINNCPKEQDTIGD